MKKRPNATPSGPAGQREQTHERDILAGIHGR